jgi:hypothetical protein
MPNFPIQDGRTKIYKDADGHDVVVSTYSLLGPHPLGDESRTGQRQTPIKFWKDGTLYDWRTTPKEKPATGYSNPVDDPEYTAKFWPGNFGTPTP